VHKVNYRRLGSTDLEISELSFGTWAIGGDWGNHDDRVVHIIKPLLCG